jgi:rRNA maturation RNase YbeY
VSVLFVGDGAMRSLNRRYRRKDRTTDVLSFPFREGAYDGVQPDILGDIVISVPVSERQARQYGETNQRALDRLLVHGLLHLLGYDHERGAAEARRMEARERVLLEALAK